MEKDKLDLDMLFQLPPQSINELDGDGDSRQHWKLVLKCEEIREYMDSCGLEEYISMIVHFFIDDYPHCMSVISILGSNSDQEFSADGYSSVLIVSGINRKEVVKIYAYYTENEFYFAHTMYKDKGNFVSELELVFTENVNEEYVISALQGKAYSESMVDGAKELLLEEDCGLEKIVLSGTSLRLYINRSKIKAYF